MSQTCMSVFNQEEIDKMIDLDGTPNKSKLALNLGVSQFLAKAAAAGLKLLNT